jgi:hypothetical protein
VAMMLATANVVPGNPPPAGVPALA